MEAVGGGGDGEAVQGVVKRISAWLGSGIFLGASQLGRGSSLGNEGRNWELELFVVMSRGTYEEFIRLFSAVFQWRSEPHCP